MSTPLRTYYRGHSLVAMRDEVAGQNRYYHFDHQGTTQCLTDSTGAVTDRFAADAWGVQVKRTGTSINRHWYIGRSGYYRPARDIDYARARYLSLFAGRWKNPDPLRDEEARSSSYVYVANQAVRSIDPAGLFRIRDCKPLHRRIVRAVLDELCERLGRTAVADDAWRQVNFCLEGCRQSPRPHVPTNEQQFQIDFCNMRRHIVRCAYPSRRGRCDGWCAIQNRLGCSRRN